ADSDSYARACPADRRLLHRLRQIHRSETHGDIRRREAESANGKTTAGRGYPDRHPRTVARPDRTGRGEVRRPDAFRTGRGGQDARHGIHRRYQAAAESAAGETSNALFLGYDAQGYRRVVGVYPARSGTGGSDSRFLDGRYGRPMRLFRRETREKRPAD